MRIFNLVIPFAVVATAQSLLSVCESPSIVTVTVTEPPSTETIDLAAVSDSILSSLSHQQAAGSALIKTNPINVAASVDSYPNVVAANTVVRTVTEVVSIVQALDASGTPTQGSYFFSDQSGIPVWLGGNEPASTDTLVVHTTTVTVDPEPTSQPMSTGDFIVASATVTSTTENQQATSVSTVFLTIISTEYHTETATESTSTVSTSAHVFSGFGHNGWNTSFSTFKTLKSTVASIGTQGAVRTRSSSSVPSPSGGFKKDLKARQVGAIVVATIDGNVVSWTNSYDGSSPATSDPALIDTLISQPVPNTVGLSIPSVSTEGTLLSPNSSPVPRSSFSLIGVIPSGSPLIAPQPSFASLTVPPPTVTYTVVTISPTQATTSISISTAPFLNSTATSDAAAPTSSFCGPTGKFTVTFDDLPTFAAANNDTDYPPIFNPYHSLEWSEGFAYAPPPEDPYTPISLPQLAIFIVNASANVHSVDSSGGGGLSAGFRSSDTSFWFDAYGAYLGCNNAGPANCVITINGYMYSAATADPAPAITQTVTQPPCPDLVNCTLAPVVFEDNFRSLTGLQFTAKVNNAPVTWFMDNLELGWTNSTCAAGLQRADPEGPEP